MDQDSHGQEDMDEEDKDQQVNLQEMDMDQKEESSLHTTNSYSISVVENLLKELKHIVQSEVFNLDVLTSWIVEHQNDFDNILQKVNNPSRSTVDSHHGIVPATQEYLFPSFTRQYVPVSTTGDGNCLYHMLSLNLIGTEEYMKHLRLLCAYSLITNQHDETDLSNCKIKPTSQG